MKAGILVSFLFVSVFFSCSQKQHADFVVHNAVVYTADSAFATTTAFAVKDGKFLGRGTDEEIFSKYESDNKIDLQGKPVYPGFIDAHCHFLYYGLGIAEVNLVGTKSFEEVIKKLIHEGQCNKSRWIKGRGWDQNDWANTSYPDKEKLDSLYPDVALFLKRIDGHAALVNSETLRRAGITTSTKVDGGKIEIKNGKLTGILIDNAMEIVEKIIPAPSDLQLINALQLAEKNCFSAGLTTVDDAGLNANEVHMIDSLQKSGLLKMRIYAMLTPNPENDKKYFGRENGTYKTERLNVRSVKLYADGALGSRGACLLEPYTDMPDQQGFLLNSAEYYRKICQQCFTNGFQVNTHCIGDSANRLFLNLYGEFLKSKNDKRWRIEHAQVVNENDFELFDKYSVLPSVQTSHATSDMYWSKDRIGENRMKGSYAYKRLMEENGLLANGSDFPVESIQPILGFYAAVSRKDKTGYPEGGFQKDQALSREQALLSMTLWAAFANFEEHEKGSIEAGKYADFVVLNQDIMKIQEDKIPEAKVLKTYIHGELVFLEKE